MNLNSARFKRLGKGGIHLASLGGRGKVSFRSYDITGQGLSRQGLFRQCLSEYCLPEKCLFGKCLFYGQFSAPGQSCAGLFGRIDYLVNRLLTDSVFLSSVIIPWGILLYPLSILDLNIGIDFRWYHPVQI
jgi:hypothetical protein